MTGHPMTASVAPAMNEHGELPQEGLKPSARYAAARGEMAGMDQGMRVLSYLIAGVLVYGVLGWVGDHYLGTAFLLPIGIVLGAAGGCYAIIKRYGQVPGASKPAVSAPAMDHTTKDKNTEGAQ